MSESLPNVTHVCFMSKLTSADFHSEFYFLKASHLFKIKTRITMLTIVLKYVSNYSITSFFNIQSRTQIHNYRMAEKRHHTLVFPENELYTY